VVQTNTASPQASDCLHLRLSTPVNSSTSTAGAQIEAVVSQPYYQADHQLALSRRDQNHRDGPESLLRGADAEKRKASCLHSAPSRSRTVRREKSIQLSEAFKPSVRKAWTSVRRAKLELRLRLSRAFSLPFHWWAHREQLRTRLCRRTHGLGPAKAGRASACSGPAPRRHLQARQLGSDTLAPQRDFAMHSSRKVQPSNFGFSSDPRPDSV
jgi:hypothetical protein